jgi:hypothetical protein
MQTLTMRFAASLLAEVSFEPIGLCSICCLLPVHLNRGTARASHLVDVHAAVRDFRTQRTTNALKLAATQTVRGSILHSQHHHGPAPASQFPVIHGHKT